MRGFATTLRALVGLGLLLAPLPLLATGIDRAMTIRQIEQRLEALDRYDAQSYALWQSSLRGKDISAARAALGQPPRLDDLKNSAMQVLAADARDAGALVAIRVILLTQSVPYDDKTARYRYATPEGDLHRRMAALLLEHHLARASVLQVIACLNLDSGSEVSFWMKVYDSPGTHRSVRANAAAWLMDRALEESPERGRAYAKIVREQFADVPAGPSLRIPRYMDRSAPLAAIVANREALLAHAAGARLPSMQVSKVEGGTDELRLHHGKLLLIDFWATWCAACKADQATLVSLQRELAGSAFELISISVDDTAADVTKYLRKHPLPWVHWHIGPQAALLREWGVQGFPTYLLVDGDGMVHLRGDGRALPRIARELRRACSRAPAHHSTVAAPVPCDPL
jgi:thiol-disulfide isomerase/thioredoxin